MKDTLIYVGAHVGGSLRSYVNNYKNIYAFEANPELYSILVNKFKNNTNVKIINAAVCDKHNEVIEFNISKNNGDSSSILEPNKNHGLFPHIETIKKVKVPAVSIDQFCLENGIDVIDTYVSDLQGYDFIVLKTLKNLIDNKRIKEIQCEVEKDDRPTIYDCVDINRQNKESNFNKLLGENYRQSARGWGNLTDGSFNGVPNEWDEMDIKWVLK